MSKMTAQNYFAHVTQVAKELDAAEKSGGPLPPEVLDGEFTSPETCAQCHVLIPSSQRKLRCSACKAVIYCSQKCAKEAWGRGILLGVLPNSINSPTGPPPTHKIMCKENQRHMRLVPEIQSTLQSFPWGRLEHDNTFHEDLARGRFAVLGGTGTGFWSQRGGPVPHSDTGHGELTERQFEMGPPNLREIANLFKHLDGYDLLHRKEHLTDEEGWRLAPELIPYRDMLKLPKERRPGLVTDFEDGIKDWESWYQWRKLPKKSPAALLMHYPLTVYHLIVNTLKQTRPKAGRPDRRVELSFHVLGAEVELNMLPIFSEIALLLPYHDISLTLYGYGVHQLAQAAKKEGIDGSPMRIALAAKCPIFEYAAPAELGSGTLKIYVAGHTAVWDNDELLLVYEKRHVPKPHAALALNAGFGAYRTWGEACFLAHTADLPFAVTEYMEQALEMIRKTYLPLVIQAGPNHPVNPDAPPRTHDIAFNPFHRPGQRTYTGWKVPNLVNGFSLVVVDGPPLNTPEYFRKVLFRSRT